MARAKTGSVNSLLDHALADELKEVTRRWGDDAPQGKKKGDFIYGSVERCRIIDRCIKLETMKLKIDDPAFGANFSKLGADDEK